MIIDTHAHVAESCLLARTVAAIERGYPILPVTELIKEMDAHGVSKAVLIQWGGSFDHHYLDHCLKAYPNRFAAVCEVDSRRDDACRLLRCLVEKHGFRGVRLSTTDRSPGHDELAIWKTAAELGVVVSASVRSSQEFVEGLTDVVRQIPKLIMHWNICRGHLTTIRRSDLLSNRSYSTRIIRKYLSILMDFILTIIQITLGTPHFHFPSTNNSCVKL